MSRVLVEVGFPESESANKLCEALGDPLAWAYAVKLWCWAMAHGCRDGVVHMPSPRRLHDVCAYRGKRSLASAMTYAGLLEDLGEGKFRIKGWDINTRYFKEKDRLSEFHKRRKFTRDSRVQYNAAVTRIPSPFPSLKEEEATAQIPINERRPKIDARALELEKYYLERRGRFGQRLTPGERTDLNSIIEAAGDESKAAIDRFLDDTNEYYVKRKWPINVLLRDLGQHLGSTTKVQPKPNLEPWDPSIARREAFKAMSEENKRRMDEASAIKTDPTLAAEQIKKIMEKIGE